MMVVMVMMPPTAVLFYVAMLFVTMLTFCLKFQRCVANAMLF